MLKHGLNTRCYGRARLCHGGGLVSDRTDGLGERQAERALSDLYRLTSAWLVRRLRRRFGDAAEDLAQGAYLAILPYSRGGGVRHPRALLLKIALRQGARDSRRSLAAPVIEASGAGPATLAPDQIDALLLKQIVLEMPPLLRDVFVLSRFAHLTYDEIGERLGISVKTVEWRMSKALAHCAAQLRL